MPFDPSFAPYGGMFPYGDLMGCIHDRSRIESESSHCLRNSITGYGQVPEGSAKVLATEQYLFDSLSTPTGMPRHQVHRNGGMVPPFHGVAPHHAAADLAEAPSFYNYSYDEIKALRAQRAVRIAPPIRPSYRRRLSRTTSHRGTISHCLITGPGYP